MAGFRTHVSTSSLLGTAYAGLGYMHGMPPDSAAIAGAMCGFAGMLPDLDSDSGVPLREAMSFTAATVPMLLLNRLATLGLRYDQMAIISVGIYFLFRFGLANMIRKYTVHRGMFHSLPALLIVGGIAYLLCGGNDLTSRYFKAGGVMLGYLSHLVLDEIYAFEWTGGRWKMKKSFGTAMKLWGDDGWSNFSTYGKLFGVGAMILGEGNVMQRIQSTSPQLAQTIQQLQQQYPELAAQLSSVASAARAQINTANTPYANGQPGSFPPSQGAPYPQQGYSQQGYPGNIARPSWPAAQPQAPAFNPQSPGYAPQAYPQQAYGQPPAPSSQPQFQPPAANYPNGYAAPYQTAPFQTGPQSQATIGNNWNTAQRPTQQFPQ
jgi:hypothetical protein